MLYNLIQCRLGKEIVVMTDELSKVKDYMKTLRKSQHKGIKGQAVNYKIDARKYRQNPIRKLGEVALGGY